MKQSFDQEIRDSLRQDRTEIPEAVRQRTETLLDSLPEKDNVPQLRILPGGVRKLAAAAACILFVMLVLLPNFSVTYAHAVEDIPVIGNLVEIFTLRNYSYSDGGHELDAHVPEIKDPDHGQISDLINKDVSDLTGEIIQRFYDDLEISNDTGYGSIYIDYETVTNTDAWFTLKLTVSELEAGSNTYFRFYHIDRTEGAYVTFGDLFDSRGRKAIERIILDQMAGEMEANPNVDYWIDEADRAQNMTILGQEQNFYFNEAGHLVIVFNKYDVAPGSMGCPEFELTPEECGPYMNSQYQKLLGAE